MDATGGRKVRSTDMRATGIQFAVALLIFVAGRVAVVVLLHRSLLPQFRKMLVGDGSCAP
jgi:hypothetical protein